MKHNCKEDQIHFVDDDVDPINFIRNFTKTGIQEQPFFVFEVEDVINKCLEWKEKLSRITPYYAVKCNTNAMVLKVLSNFGAGFDCGSKEEMEQVLSLNIDGSRIIFANTIKQPSHINYASENGVQLTTVDNESELYKIKAQHPNAKVLLRIRSDATVSSHNMGIKFGSDVNSECPILLRLAQTLGLDVAGIAFHVGSVCGEAEAYRRGIILADGLFNLGKSMGLNMRILDIGGGFKGVKGSSIDEMAKIINDALDEYFPPERNVMFIAEPGRYFVASAFTLATLVYSKRVITDGTTNSLSHMYYINEGIYGSFNPIRDYAARLYPIPLVDKESRKNVSCSIWGPTCNARDCIIEKIEFPELNVGDWIAFENMGSYTFTGACNFNGFPITRTVSILKKSSKTHLKNILDWIEEQATSNN